MRVFLSKKIRKQEFGRAVSQEDLAVIARTARIALAIRIAGKGLPPGTQLIKAYGTSPRGPKRVVYLLTVGDDDQFLLFYRDKNDPIGRNASTANPAFRSALQKHLALLEEDIASANIKKLPLPDTP
jgi:hypothetical protein